MPLKLNVGLTRIVGLQEDGSFGASCHVEVELEGSILQNDLNGFYQEVRKAFAACRQAVTEELNRASANGQTTVEVKPAGKLNAGRPSANGNHPPGAATDKQLRYVRQLAGQINELGVRGIDGLSQRMFSKPLATLLGLEASALIDMLKAIKDGHVALDDALNGAAQ